ncbi:GNAT family N-acetyltransferase [Roseateles amylovorans]|uniref:GNAT family N-acetyltransferase n=1 Tax=Roseateles amylovorans TaxID=2978473 RepID=A0ABY6AYR6_9BURK|nr:GNAT family protein [Roseateles amylovorans]UXH77544.1 GNAT family N-acetyltransferase [Roseateles amylovorans]
MNHNDPVLIQVPEILATDHLLLMAPQTVDGDGVLLNFTVNASLEHLRPWMPWAQERPTVEQSEAIVRRMKAQFLTREHLAYFLYERDADGLRGSLIGGAGLVRLDWLLRRFEIGYWLAPTATGRGLASQAVQALSRLAFGALRARRVEIRTDARNHASRAVALRCGFQLEGVLRNDALGVDGLPTDTCIFGLIDVADLRDPSADRMAAAESAAAGLKSSG